MNSIPKDFIFPFIELSTDELIEYLWNERDPLKLTSRSPINEMIFNFCDKINNNDNNSTMSSPVKLNENWNPADCKYYTVDEVNISKDSLSVLQINCRSLPKNFQSIETLILNLSSKPSVICLSETWLNDENYIFYNIEGYKLFSKSRPNKRGGGVGIYVSNGFDCTIKADQTNCLDNICETILLDISYRSCKYTIISLYRPPSGDLNEFNSALSLFLDSNMRTFKGNTVIAGDFNIDLLKTEQHSDSNGFFDTMLLHGFVPTITRPSRITESSFTLIDNIFVNCFSDSYSSGLIYENFSDHLPTFTNIFPQIASWNVDSYQKQSYRSYKKENFNTFENELRSQDWSVNEEDSNDPNVLYDAFLTKFKSVFEFSFPVLHRTKDYDKIRKPWITQNLIKCIHEKSKLYKIFRQCPTLINRIKFKRYSNVLKRSIREAESTYYQTEIRKKASNMRETWAVINKLLNRPASNKTQLTKVKLKSGSITSDAKEMASYFNEYFSNIAENLAGKIPLSNNSPIDYLKSTISGSLVNNFTNKYEIEIIIDKLKNKFSSGPDEIPTSVIKAGKHCISDALSSIINVSLSTGIFPDALKIAKVTPVFKSGDLSSVENYRPISVLNNFSKIFENVISNRLIGFLDKHNIITPSQCGFRRGYSTSMALITFSDYLAQAKDNKEHVISIFVDLSKAFDTVDHKILAAKLYRYGIRGKPLDLLVSYLSNRRQSVSVNGTCSPDTHINYGVPQGSILGPILFLLYINDLVNASDFFKYILFADDTTLLAKSKSLSDLETKINHHLKDIYTWFCCNKLSLNITKTKYLLFRSGRCTTEPNLSIHTTKLIRYTSAKFLGVEIDDKLTWHKQISNISHRISYIISHLGRIKYKINTNTAILLYNTLILPHLTYCNIVWANTHATHINKLVNLQNRALRICYGSDDAVLNSNKLTIYNLYKLEVLKFVFKFQNHMLPSLFNGFFTLSMDNHNYNTRQRSDFQLPITKTCFSKFSLKFSGPKLWNDLPDNIKNITTFHKLVKYIKLLLSN